MVHQKIRISRQELVGLENPSRQSTQYIAALVATFGGLVAGTCLSWTAPAEKPLKEGFFGYTANDDQFAWIGSVMPLGAMIGSLITAAFVDIVGRKYLILVLAIPCLIGWLSMAFSISVLMMCIGRFLTGISTGSFVILAPMYTAEIGEKDIRGTLGTYLQLQLVIGILFTYVVGSIIDVFWFTLVCGMFPLIYIGLMSFIPESPFFHMLRKDIPGAVNSLAWLRGSSYDGKIDVEIMQKTINDDEANKVSLLQGFRTTPAKKGLLISLGVMFLQQFSGINAAIFYATSIFRDAVATLDPNMCTIVFGIVQVVATWVATLIVDKYGRRVLLLYSIIISTISTFILGLYFLLKINIGSDVAYFSWLPLLSLSIYIIVFSLGLGPIPWVLMAEIFPSKIRSSACSLVGLSNWLCVFLVTKLFPILKVQVGPGFTFWCFSFCSGIGILFILFVVPETKGKTLEEVQAMLGSEKGDIDSVDRVGINNMAFNHPKINA